MGSPKIQNELIQCAGQNLRENLISEINTSLCYSLLLDTTQDLMKKDQLSVMIRHVHILRNDRLESQGFEIKETFLGFFDQTDLTAEGMKNKILSILDEMKIPIEECIGQGYDGANVMSGIYNGLQQKIKNIQQNAEYVHCASHNLNLVVKDAIEKKYI